LSCKIKNECKKQNEDEFSGNSQATLYPYIFFVLPGQYSKVVCDLTAVAVEILEDPELLSVASCRIFEVAAARENSLQHKRQLAWLKAKQEPPPMMDNGQPAEFSLVTGSAGPAIKIAAHTRVLMEAKMQRYFSPFFTVFT